ncbi:hypothetical protein FI667_g17587, partial [Globisporangium splendens]
MPLLNNRSPEHIERATVTRHKMAGGRYLMALSALVAAAMCVPQAQSAAMKPVRVIQARVQGDQPEWNAEQGTFVSTFGATFAEKYRAVFDTVNTASVEGALMYVQAEGINVLHNTECKRKNNMQYVVFYELSVLQPDASIAKYDSDASNIPEYGPFIAMDGGACTKSGTELPEACTAIFGGGVNASVKVGPSVGASLRETDPRAPYPHNIWYSFPNSCVMNVWAEKDAACRAKYPGGLCAFGSQPDGEVCTFTYKTLGYINLDDLVGITQLNSSVTGQPYKNYTEFCLDKDGQFGGVEFSATDGVVNSVTAIPFWEQPYNPEACSQRAATMVELYNNLTRTSVGSHMTPLPTVAALTSENPPCYVNSKRCAESSFGCKRELYSQVCTVCTAEEEGCVKQSYSLN